MRLATQDLERLFAVSSLFVQRTWLDCFKQSNPFTKVKITISPNTIFVHIQYSDILFSGQRGDQAGWEEEEDETDLPLQAELLQLHHESPLLTINPSL